MKDELDITCYFISLIDSAASVRCEKQQTWSKETSDVIRKCVAVLKQILY